MSLESSSSNINTHPTKMNASKILELLKGIFISFLILGIPLGLSLIYSPKGSYRLYFISVFIMILQWFGFIFSSGILGNTPTEKYYDITGSVTYVLTLLFYFITAEARTKRKVFATVFGLLWSIRLGWFLFSRISKNSGIDDRFTEIKSNLTYFLVAWTTQGLWIFLTLFSILTLKDYRESSSLNLLNFLGIFIFIFGFSIEIISDHQKSIFRNDLSNKNKFISTGFWKYSRHPNYFGEIILWIGVSFVCFYSENNKILSFLRLAISPSFVAFLLIFISGIPILEKKADLRFSKDKEYLKYKEETAVLIPFLKIF